MSNKVLVCQEEDKERQIETLKQELAAADRKIKQLEKKAFLCPLTRLPNRLAFKSATKRELARQRRSGQPLSVVILDIDHFKQVNDQYGHDAGDTVLRRFAKVLMAQMRETDFVARLGGEEFVFIMPGETASQSFVAVERVRLAAAACKVKIGSRSISFTVSAGIATHGKGDDFAGSLKRADRALYQAKHGGRNQVVVYQF